MSGFDLSKQNTVVLATCNQNLDRLNRRLSDINTYGYSFW